MLLIVESILIFRNVFWNETGDLVCLATEDCYFILQVDTAAIQTAIDGKQGLGDDGLESAFDVNIYDFVFNKNFVFFVESDQLLIQLYETL